MCFLAVLRLYGGPNDLEGQSLTGHVSVCLFITLRVSTHGDSSICLLESMVDLSLGLPMPTYDVGPWVRIKHLHVCRVNATSSLWL